MTHELEREPDPSDIASNLEELDRQSAMIGSRRPAGPEFTGRCHYCDEPVDHPRRFCNAECRDGWDREHRR